MNLRLVSQEHSQLPTKSFRLSPGLRANAALFLPWIHTPLLNFSVRFDFHIQCMFIR
ncbi:hypothetical protein MKW98_020830 [Papaver atlanticum]|uniref:Uncharacterized protein n=1 Tax=Papaver atlanticum TaxID=357466 RepID=A0AAD4TIE2_9MAGN|nr:hypothetical protein MKW98_020830 [Papaver atlanticum]